MEWAPWFAWRPVTLTHRAPSKPAATLTPMRFPSEMRLVWLRWVYRGEYVCGRAYRLLAVWEVPHIRNRERKGADAP